MMPLKETVEPALQQEYRAYTSVDPFVLEQDESCDNTATNIERLLSGPLGRAKRPTLIWNHRKQANEDDERERSSSLEPSLLIS